MLVAATVDGIVESSTKPALKQISTALAALPSTYGDLIPTNAALLGFRVEVPTRDTDDPTLLLWPSDPWIDGEMAWTNANTGLSLDKPFALDAPTVDEAKKRVAEMLGFIDKTATTETPPPDEPIETPIPASPPEPTTTLTTTEPPKPEAPPPSTPPSPIDTKAGITWPYWLIGGVGAATFIGLLVRRRPGPKVGALAGRKIKGTFCEEKLASKETFDPASFRWKRSGDAWVLVGCPKGKWAKTEQWCRVGTRGYRVLTPTKKGRCPRSAKRITK